MSDSTTTKTQYSVWQGGTDTMLGYVCATREEAEELRKGRIKGIVDGFGYHPQDLIIKVRMVATKITVTDWSVQE